MSACCSCSLREGGPDTWIEGKRHLLYSSFELRRQWLESRLISTASLTCLLRAVLHAFRLLTLKDSINLI